MKPPQSEIDEVLNQCVEQEEEGGTKWSGMTYEQGVKAGIEWVLGYTTENPMNE